MAFSLRASVVCVGAAMNEPVQRPKSQQTFIRTKIVKKTTRNVPRRCENNVNDTLRRRRRSAARDHELQKYYTNAQSRKSLAISKTRTHQSVSNRYSIFRILFDIILPRATMRRQTCRTSASLRCRQPFNNVVVVVVKIL
jgi:hypothetical protein